MTKDPIRLVEWEPTHAFDGAHDQHMNADMQLAQLVGDELNDHYPGHVWCVNVDSIAGVVRIWLGGFSEQWPMIIHLRQINSDPSLKSVMLCGGEYLERMGMPTSGRLDRDALMKAYRQWGGPLNRKLKPGEQRKMRAAPKIDWRTFRERVEAEQAQGKPLPENLPEAPKGVLE